MYTLKDYIKNGRIFTNNLLRPHHKQLTSLMLYTSTRCNSRCRHCNIWKKPKVDMSLDDINKIMSSKCITPNTTVGLEGGEFVLHPQAKDILSWFHENHPNYTLLSNCLLPEKVIEFVKLYPPRHLYVSLDGPKSTYINMRGVDGHDKVIRVIEALRKNVPISIMFCLSPWNTFEDMEYCIRVANQYSIDIRIGIYNTMAFFDTSTEMISSESEYIMQIPQNVHGTSENFDFIVLYKHWRKGDLNLRCHSIMSQLVIHPDGTVPICQNLDTALGNIHDKTLDEIFNSNESISLQQSHSRECNDCWINYHRKYDIILMRNLERLLPKPLIEQLYGKYQWCANNHMSYRTTLKNICKSEKTN